jgi:hypothetical protein
MPGMERCENCGKPATVLRDEHPTCDTCIPADWSGAMRAIGGEPAVSMLSREAAAKTAGVSVSTLDRAIKSARLATVNMGGRVLIDPVTLSVWLKSKER